MKSTVLNDLASAHPSDVQLVVKRVLQIEKEYLSYQKGTATRKVMPPLDELITEVAERTLQSEAGDAR